MRRILDNVRGIVRTQGVPAHCRIEFASVSEQASGCAGFRDAPDSFEQPFILLDTSTFHACSRDEVLDVYCGLALHEAGHILHTREGYRRPRGSQLLAMFDNLWEDERIEALIRRDSPGFAPLLEATRQALIVAPHREQSWDLLPDLDRLRLLEFMFIRCPHVITPEMKDWWPSGEVRPFDRLCFLFPHGPRTESEVDQFARRAEQLWNSMRDEYPDAPQDFVTRRAANRISDRNAPCILAQLEADAMDRAATRVDDEGDVQDAVDQLVQEAAEFERCAGLSSGDDALSLREIAERLLNTAAQIDQNDQWMGNGQPRFSERDLQELLDGTQRVRQTLSESEWVDVHHTDSRGGDDDDDAPSRSVEVGDCWDWGDDRRTLIEYPQATSESRRRVEAARKSVAALAAALRRVFQMRDGQITHSLRDRRSGQLDRRRLWRGAFDDRLFVQQETVPDTGLALCLLIDESGSMWQGEPQRIDVACEVAVMISEAVRGLPNVELEIYSHTSDAETDHHCAVRYLYGRRNHDMNTLAEWSEGIENYDHQAIITASRLFVQNTTRKNRWMIVLSDGAPAGQNYHGDQAIEATRDAVRASRRSGIRVLNVAIEDYDSEQIFGEGFVLKFTSHTELVTRMRRLVTTLAR